MNSHLGKSLIVFLVMVLGLTGCGNQAAPPQPMEAAAPLSPTNTTVPPTPTDEPTLPPTSTSVPPLPTATQALPPVCLSIEPQETSSELKPKEVVSEMVAALNTGDVATAMSFFAEDAKGYVFGLPPNPFQSMNGREEVCRLLAGYANNNVEWELTNLFSINAFGGADVSAKSNIGLDEYRQLGIASIQFLDKFLVREGKITEYEAWLAEGSLDQLREVLPEIAFTNPDTSSEMPGSEITIVFSNHSCTYEGPSAWQSGYIDFTINVLDHKDVQNALLSINVDEGYDVFDLAVALIGETPMWVHYSRIFDHDYYDTSTNQYLISEGGKRHLVCLGGDRGWVIGIFGPFEVIP
jgi:hypothetical protein